jgi:catalase
MLVSDGVKGAAVDALKQAAQAAGAKAVVVGPRAQGVTTAEGKPLAVDHALVSVSSVLFDAVYVPDGDVGPLLADPMALLFVCESYKHFKPVGAGGNGATLMAEAARAAGLSGGFAGPGVVIGKDDNASQQKSFLAALGEHRWWDRPDAARIMA